MSKADYPKTKSSKNSPLKKSDLTKLDPPSSSKKSHEFQLINKFIYYSLLQRGSPSMLVEIIFVDEDPKYKRISESKPGSNVIIFLS